MPQGLEGSKIHKEKFLSLTPEEEAVGKAIVNAAYVVHKALGPGLLEKVYEVCLCYVLIQKGYFVKRQIDVPITLKILYLMKGCA